MKILIAEDNQVTLLMLEQCLKSEGYEVMAAVDGRHALQLLETESPDLIITDIMMPFTSGLEFIGIVKSSPRRIIPIIVLSAIDEESTVMEAFELGADDFIAKPFNAKELILRIKRFLFLHANPLRR
jgi:DNA-binding response OmpR family regulator